MTLGRKDPALRRGRNMFLSGVAVGSFLATGFFLLPSSGAIDVLSGAQLSLDGEIAPEAEERILEALDLMAQALVLVEQNHIDRSIDRDTAEQMLNAALYQLDPSSGFLPEAAARALMAPAGDPDRPRLGVLIMDLDGRYTIEAVTPGSPAERVGIMPGDAVIRVGDRRLSQASPHEINDEISREIAARPGEEISLGILRRGGSAEVAISIRPEPVKAVGVHHLGRTDGVVHLQVEKFYEGMADDVAAILNRERLQGGLKGVVMDLRGNLGGLTSEVLHLASLFLPEGELLYSMTGKGVGSRTVVTRDAPPFGELPLSIIINRDTASASEIFAGAIQATGRGKVLGWTSYGKGTVQRIYPVGAGAVKITVAEYLDAGLRPIHGVGVQPDIVISEEDPGYRPSRFQPDPARDRAISLITEVIDVAQE